VKNFITRLIKKLTRPAIEDLSHRVSTVVAEICESSRKLDDVKDQLDQIQKLNYERLLEERAKQFSKNFPPPTSSSSDGSRPLSEKGALEKYFDKNTTGRGIWKWRHYFPIYEKYLKRFIGKPSKLVEIGVYSGGSLRMWKDYLGEECEIIGIDIENDCKAYEESRVRIEIGDQADSSFWNQFKMRETDINVLIDDGGHTPEQQAVTLQEMLPHLSPGGVYICEDIHYSDNSFINFAAGLVRELNSFEHISGSALSSKATAFQKSIYGIHFYPYLMVIEKSIAPPLHFECPRRGTEWQPFFDHS
jgi:cephalosporin hydroxylase